MTRLPRSFEYREGDTLKSVGQRIAEWTRDVIALLRAIPDVFYREVPWTGAPVTVAAGKAPRSVLVARVESGTVTGAVSVEWEPAATGFILTAVHGISGDAVLSLRVEV